MPGPRAAAGPAPDQAWTVADLVGAVKAAVESAVGEVWVVGEVTEFKAYASGHWYFTLKGGGASVRCVMWKSHALRSGRPPENGTEVFLLGEPGVYEERGEFRVQATRLLPTSQLGAAQRELERVKAALAADGLFDPARKRPLPEVPAAIALVTSPDGAALRDLVTVARRRWPLVRLVLVPTRVQGELAAAELARALGLVNRLDVDLCIVGRGGGGKEDLAVFNHEAVCRALAAVRVPTISAVGHETDLSFTDLVADMRAPTPSAAMELALPDRAEVEQRAAQLGARLAGGLARRTRVYAERLERAGDRMEGSLAARVQAARERLARQSLRLEGAVRRRLEAAHYGLGRAAAQLEALSPLRVLARGFAVAQGADGRILRRTADLPAGTPFRLRVSDGAVAARVEPA